MGNVKVADGSKKERARKGPLDAPKGILLSSFHKLIYLDRTALKKIHGVISHGLNLENKTCLT